MTKLFLGDSQSCSVTNHVLIPMILVDRGKQSCWHEEGNIVRLAMKELH